MVFGAVSFRRPLVRSTFVKTIRRAQMALPVPNQLLALPCRPPLALPPMVQPLALPCTAHPGLLHGLQNAMMRGVSWYAKLSEARPYLVAALTATSILTFADISSQAMEAAYTRKTQGGGGLDGFSWDKKRTLALASFGFLYYGGPCKFLYMGYDRVFSCVVKKTLFDSCVHTPFLMIPSFYFLTCSIKGKSLKETYSQLKKEWYESATGSICFWGPTSIINFAFVPQHSRLLVVSSMSFFHKTWLSWVSNKGNDGPKTVTVNLQIPAPAQEVRNCLPEADEVIDLLKTITSRINLSPAISGIVLETTK